MGIPTTKASTANVDQGSDRISLARPDIKQNIDNVNEIIDHLTDSVTQKVAIIEPSDTETQVSGDTYKKHIKSSTLVDPDNLVTLSSDTFTLAAGTYLVTCNDYPKTGQTTGGDPTITLHNETDDTTFATIDVREIGSTNTFYFRGHDVVTISTAKSLSFRITGTSRFGLNPIVILHKIR